MKIIHTADIHLGSKMDSKFPKEIADKRKTEIRNTFSRMVDYATDNGVTVIILAGDVFDYDIPFKKDKDFFYSVVKKHPQIDFLYLKGNHDLSSYVCEDIKNLKTFGSHWTAFEYGDIVISGIEMTGDNATSLYSSLELNPDKKNIVVLHGQIADTMGVEKVCLKKLRNKNIDYLALGHVHKLQSGRVDERGEYAYSGCLEGRGFDETGDHGFVLIDSSNGKLERKFIDFAERKIIEVDADISEAKDAYSAFNLIIEKFKFEKENIYRINLVGEVDIETENMSRDIEKYLANKCFFVNVKDKTTKKIDIESFAKGVSLKSEFIRNVFAADDISEDDKKMIVRCGLKALKGEEIDL